MSIYDGDSVAAYVRGQAKIKEKNRRVRRQVTKEISDIDSLSDSEKQTLIDDYLRKMDSDALSTRIAPIFGGRIQNVSKYGEGGTLGVPIQALTRKLRRIPLSSQLQRRKFKLLNFFIKEFWGTSRRCRQARSRVSTIF